MRPHRIGAWVGAALTVVACAHSPAPAPSAATAKSQPAHGFAVNPANIKRVVRDLPAGYEVTTGPSSGASPRAIWGLDAGAGTAPPPCATLADPGDGLGGRGQSAQGVSGSGTGGIVDAVVVTLPEPVHLDHDLVAACGEWSMTAGHTTANVHLDDGPHVDGADTVGMAAEIRSSVESGTEIDSRAYTYTAYLGNYYAFTTLIADPGSALPALPPGFAADLLVKTVSALRG